MLLFIPAAGWFKMAPLLRGWLCIAGSEIGFGRNPLNLIRLVPA